jgi:hypothetical protein
VLRDASPGGGLLRVLSAAAAYRAQTPDSAFDIAAPQHRQQARMRDAARTRAAAAHARLVVRRRRC